MSRYLFKHLPDQTLVREFTSAVAHECQNMAVVIAYLGEVDARRLYAPAGYASMFEYCVREVHFSEDVAYKRIQVARAARQFPSIYDLLADGRLHLSVVLTLSAHLTAENADELLAAAVGQTRAGIEQMLAERFPQPDVSTLIAPLAATSCGDQLAPGRVDFSTTKLASSVPAPATPPAPPAKVAPLAPERYAIQCTVGQGTFEKLKHAQELLGHSVPTGELAQVLDRALDALIEKLEHRKFARTERPRACHHSDNARQIPAEVKRAVWEQDGRGGTAPQRTRAGRPGGRRPTGRQVPRRQAATGRRREPCLRRGRAASATRPTKPRAASVGTSCARSGMTARGQPPVRRSRRAIRHTARHASRRSCPRDLRPDRADGILHDMAQHDMKPAIVVGTRPEIIKMAPVVRACRARGLPALLLHTGQHYSFEMDGVFFAELGLPAPDVNLEIGSGTQVYQLASAMSGLEPVLAEHRPDIVLVEGDTNSVLAAAMAASRAGIAVGHVEAGLRSYDRRMPEELNRILADHISDHLFAPTEEARAILRGEGIPDARIAVTGNTVVDELLLQRERARDPGRLGRFGVAAGRFALATLHRAENVDDPQRLRGCLRGLAAVAQALDLPVLAALHPRTQARVAAADPHLTDGLRVLPPLGYLDFLGLHAEAALMLTDSGGLQEEACCLGVPCVTLRDNTERPESVAAGANVLAGADPEKIVAAARDMLPRRGGWANPFGDGHAGERIVERLIAS